jgi:hypothetical protein
MSIQVAMNGDHNVLLNECGNVFEAGRTAAERKVRELRRSGHFAYPMRFSPRIYFVGVADSAAKASALREVYDLQRAEIHRILVANLEA